MKTINDVKDIPAIDKILNFPELKEFADVLEHNYLLKVVRERTAEFRKRILNKETLSIEDLKKSIVEELSDLIHPYYVYAINGLGVILHTGLGRAPYISSIAQTLLSLGPRYSRLQIDEDGRRADRYKRISRLLQLITDAEAGMFVNNNAAATLLILNTLCKGKEVIISRGQLIEIGGSFRIPEVMEQSGAILREVGTTNRTHLRDYESAINENTGALLRVHQSNYRIMGFTKDVSIEELVLLGRKYNLPVIDDLGSGALLDFSRYNLPKEPMVQESIKAGVDLVCFSGDKLIGGPQCGIIVGKKEYIERLKKNPLTRALRCDKLTSAVLEATLQLFLRKEEIIIENHGVMALLLKPLEKIKRQARYCIKKLKNLPGVKCEIESSVSEIGGGSLSTEQLPTFVLSIKTEKMPVEKLARAMRLHNPPIFGRIENDLYLIDFRTVFDGEEKIIADALLKILGP
ncbi:MAG: L-seryl-tRNA(Sec) selenium transferase [candidate division WOR-3 bacterium]|nr:L-seryl-tRNA(Sec) selenium transferase [candidate division WOR-3 bacterium]